MNSPPVAPCFPEEQSCVCVWYKKVYLFLSLQIFVILLEKTLKFILELVDLVGLVSNKD